MCRVFHLALTLGGAANFSFFNPLEYADHGEDNRLLQATLEELNAALLSGAPPLQTGTRHHGTGRHEREAANVESGARQRKTAWVQDEVEARDVFVSGCVISGVTVEESGSSWRLWRLTQNATGFGIEESAGGLSIAVRNPADGNSTTRLVFAGGALLQIRGGAGATAGVWVTQRGHEALPNRTVCAQGGGSCRALPWPAPRDPAP